MPTTDQQAELICDIGRRMTAAQMVAANDGNISCRLDDGTFLCTPSGVAKGQMTPEMLIVVDAEGNQLAGTGRTTSEIQMHLRIYRERPAVRAVAHAHPPHVSAFAITGTPIPDGILPEVEVLLGPVPVAAYATPGSPQVSQNVGACLAEGINTVILDHHGAVGFDVELELAYAHLETLDSYCRILLLARQLGEPIRLSQAQMDDLLAAKARMGLADPRINAPATKDKS
ncbi:MAG: class II aldolase/adducin family protein [Phycisphaerae bacterium]